MNGLSRKPVRTIATSAGSGLQLLGVVTTIPRGTDGASSAISDRPARKRWARSAREPAPASRRSTKVLPAVAGYTRPPLSIPKGRAGVRRCGTGFTALPAR